jgi:hypothetical protein
VQPTAALTGWWGTDGTSYCVVPAKYRLSGKVDGFGSCVGLNGDAPAEITMAVGQVIDIHMTAPPSPSTPSTRCRRHLRPT